MILQFTCPPSIGSLNENYINVLIIRRIALYIYIIHFLKFYFNDY